MLSMKKRALIIVLLVALYCFLLIVVPMIASRKEKKNSYERITIIDNLNGESIKDIYSIGNYEVIAKYNNDMFYKYNELNVDLIVSVSEFNDIISVDDKLINAYYISGYSTLKECESMIEEINKKSIKPIFVHCKGKNDYDILKNKINYAIIDAEKSDEYDSEDNKIISLYEASIKDWYKKYSEFVKEKKANNKKWGFSIKIIYGE